MNPLSWLRDRLTRTRTPVTQAEVSSDLWFEIQLYALKYDIGEDMAVRELIRRGLQRDVIERDTGVIEG